MAPPVGRPAMSHRRATDRPHANAPAPPAGCFECQKKRRIFCVCLLSPVKQNKYAAFECVCVCFFFYLVFSFIKFLKKRNETILFLCIFVLLLLLFSSGKLNHFAKRQRDASVLFSIFLFNLFALRTQNKNTLSEI